MINYGPRGKKRVITHLCDAYKKEWNGDQDTNITNKFDYIDVKNI